MVRISKSQSHARARRLRKLLLAALVFVLIMSATNAEQEENQPALVRALNAVPLNTVAPDADAPSAVVTDAPDIITADAPNADAPSAVAAVVPDTESPNTVAPGAGGAATRPAATRSPASGGSAAEFKPASTPTPAANGTAATQTPAPGRASPKASPVPGQITPQIAPALEQATAQPAETLVPVPSDSYIDGRDYAVLNGVPQTDHALGLPKTVKAKDSYFDRAVFVGDYITLELRNYVTKQRKTNSKFLSNAQFLAADGFATRLALQNVTRKSMHPKIKGKKMTVESVLAKSKANKVFIMLGLDDVPISGIKGAVNNMMTFVNRIRQACPKIEIYVQSAIPRLSGRPPTTQQLFEYNIGLYDAVKALGDSKVYFVDVAYVMRNSKGDLYSGFIRTEGLDLHLTDAACQRWLDYLYYHVSPGGATIATSPSPSATPSASPTIKASPAPSALPSASASSAPVVTATPEIYLPELPAHLAGTARPVGTG